VTGTERYEMSKERHAEYWAWEAEATEHAWEQPQSETGAMTIMPDIRSLFP
jgi:hypothetical protein